MSIPSYNNVQKNSTSRTRRVLPFPPILLVILLVVVLVVGRLPEGMSEIPRSCFILFPSAGVNDLYPRSPTEHEDEDDPRCRQWSSWMS
jgi:hypothetical protein